MLVRCPPFLFTYLGFLLMLYQSAERPSPSSECLYLALRCLPSSSLQIPTTECGSKQARSRLQTAWQIAGLDDEPHLTSCLLCHSPSRHHAGTLLFTLLSTLLSAASGTFNNRYLSHMSSYEERSRRLPYSVSLYWWFALTSPLYIIYSFPSL